MKTQLGFFFILVFLISSVNVFPQSSNFAQGLSYQIKISENDLPKARNLIGKLSFLLKESSDSEIYYRFGDYCSYQYAVDISSALKENDCHSADIVAIKNGDEIPLAAAISLEYEASIAHPNYASLTNQEKNIKELEYLIAIESSGISHNYNLSFNFNHIEKLDQILEFIDNNEQIHLSATQQFLHLSTNFSLDKIINLKDKLALENIADIFITAEINPYKFSTSTNLALQLIEMKNNLVSR